MNNENYTPTNNMSEDEIKEFIKEQEEGLAEMKESLKEYERLTEEAVKEMEDGAKEMKEHNERYNRYMEELEQEIKDGLEEMKNNNALNQNGKYEEFLLLEPAYKENKVVQSIIIKMITEEQIQVIETKTNQILLQGNTDIIQSQEFHNILEEMFSEDNNISIKEDDEEKFEIINGVKFTLYKPKESEEK